MQLDTIAITLHKFIAKLEIIHEIIHTPKCFANILCTHIDSVDCAFFAFIVLLCCVRCRGSPLLNHHKHFIGWNWIPFARLFFLMALYNISETLTSLIAGRELNKCIPLTLEILKTGLMIERLSYE